MANPLALRFPYPTDRSIYDIIPKVKNSALDDGLVATYIAPHTYELCEGRSLFRGAAASTTPEVIQQHGIPIFRGGVDEGESQKELKLWTASEKAKFLKYAAGPMTYIMGWWHDVDSSPARINIMQPLEMAINGNKRPMNATWTANGNGTTRFELGGSIIGATDSENSNYMPAQLFVFDQDKTEVRGLSVIGVTPDYQSNKAIFVHNMGGTINQSAQAKWSGLNKREISFPLAGVGQTAPTYPGVTFNRLSAYLPATDNGGIAFGAVYSRAFSAEELMHKTLNWYDESLEGIPSVYYSIPSVGTPMSYESIALDSITLVDSGVGVIISTANAVEAINLNTSSGSSVTTKSIAADSIELGANSSNNVTNLASSSDTALFNDIASSSTAVVASSLDTINFTSSVIANIIANASSEDSLVLNDSNTGGLLILTACIDSLLLGDSALSTASVLTVIEASCTDSIAMGDSTAAVLVALSLASEVVSLQDNSGTTINAIAFISEDISFYDSSNGNITISSFADSSLTFQDSNTGGLLLESSALDTITFDESTSSKLIVERIANEAFILQDSPSSLVGFGSQANDSLLLVDTSINTTSVISVANDSLLMYDTTLGNMDVESFSSDNISIYDTIEALIDVYPLANDNVFISDAVIGNILASPAKRIISVNAVRSPDSIFMAAIRADNVAINGYLLDV